MFVDDVLVDTELVVSSGAAVVEFEGKKFWFVEERANSVDDSL